jgi:hypothetical protein
LLELEESVTVFTPERTSRCMSQSPNSVLHLMACSLRARRCRALASRAATGEHNVGRTHSLPMVRINFIRQCSDRPSISVTTTVMYGP